MITIKAHILAILWIPLLLIWNENKEPDMHHYTVYVMDSTRVVIWHEQVMFPDTIYAYAMDDSRYKILYFYVTATDTANNESEPSDTVLYRVSEGNGGGCPHTTPESFKVSDPYPSITDGQLHISIQASTEATAQIYCYNILGEIKDRRVAKIQRGENYVGLNIQNGSGLYFIMVRIKNRAEVRRVLLIK